MKVPALTTDQMMEVDRLMIEEYGIALMQMMENAGSRLASLAIQIMKDTPVNNKVVVLCGGGNNGGGGMVAARHLHNRGVDVKIGLATNPSRMKEIPLHQWNILLNMNIQRAEMGDISKADLIIDALIGYGIRGNPQGAAAEWILRANHSGAPILALDSPSGLDATSGLPGEPCMRATATLTLALPKEGLLKESAKNFVGELYLADISVPPELYRRLGMQIGPIFTQDTIVKL
ncbi:MAG TPA: NAD(P)H-hydrate epimerase [Anaerolineaceae bacterium]|nr:NAD(P)H-hydrate epimerase [Anaerolineaceae bacterium]